MLKLATVAAGAGALGYFLAKQQQQQQQGGGAKRCPFVGTVSNVADSASVSGEPVVASTYFEHWVGLVEANLDRFRKTTSLMTAGDSRMLIIAADFNMEPDEWDQDVLDVVGLTIVAAGTEKTCKTSGAANRTTTYSSARISSPS